MGFQFDESSAKTWSEQVGEYNERLKAEQLANKKPTQDEINAALMLDIAKIKAGAK